MRELLEEYGVNHYSTRGEPKAAVVERFNRTLKELTYKYMTALNTLHYSRALPSIVDNYNNMVHSATGLAPVDVDYSNASVVWRRLYGTRTRRGRKRMWKPYAFKEGDFPAHHQVVGKGQEKGSVRGSQFQRSVVSRRVHGGEQKKAARRQCELLRTGRLAGA